ncbi:hypothetical protein, partial [Wenzhouxiangella sp. XN79A]|uniref:hypothetical protein n=1 Tax=Wenzhouxiangella sp. XN79A TaxID=2724193 RepID=UPI00197D8C44
PAAVPGFGLQAFRHADFVRFLATYFCQSRQKQAKALFEGGGTRRRFRIASVGRWSDRALAHSGCGLQWPRMHPRSQGQAKPSLVGHNRPPKRPVFEPSHRQ